MSLKFRISCGMALLACPRYYWRLGREAQKSIDEIAKTQEVIQRADEHRSLWRAGGRLEICPIGRNQRFTTVWQYKHELQAGGHAGLPQNLQRLSMKWVMRTRDSHTFGELLMMGSVSWRPSIRFRMPSYSSRWLAGSSMEHCCI
jgi:hypothetical protein